MDNKYNCFKFSVRHVVVVESERLRSRAQQCLVKVYMLHVIGRSHLLEMVDTSALKYFASPFPFLQQKKKKKKKSYPTCVWLQDIAVTPAVYLISL